MSRYWELGSLGPAETEELASKRLAALRAKEYGIRVAEMAKSTLKPKAKPDCSRAPSNRDRAMEFSKTVRAPKRVSKPEGSGSKPQGTADGAHRGRTKRGPSVNRSSEASDQQQLHQQLSVNTMVARHMDAAKKVADIKAEVERWGLEDRQHPEIPQMPKRRSPSPPRARNTTQPQGKSTAGSSLENKGSANPPAPGRAGADTKVADKAAHGGARSVPDMAAQKPVALEVDDVEDNAGEQLDLSEDDRSNT